MMERLQQARLLAIVQAAPLEKNRQIQAAPTAPEEGINPKRAQILATNVKPEPFGQEELLPSLSRTLVSQSTTETTDKA